MDLIDTHQHLILRDRFGYDWADAIPALARGDYTVADHARLTEGRGVIGRIFMETGVNDADYQAEARHVGGLVRDGTFLGQIASCRPEEEAGFDAWLDECETLGVVGFRRILHVVPDDVSQSPTFRANLKKIGRRGLPFDLCFLARQHDIASDLIAACPDQAFVLDHFGVPDVAGGAFDAWAAGITKLAAFPQLSLKFSGITAYCAPGTASDALLAPYVDHVLQAFGPDRILWGSDWPVVDLGTGLPDWIAMTRRLLAPLTAAERARIGTGTARAVYRLP